MSTDARHCFEFIDQFDTICVRCHARRHPRLICGAVAAQSHPAVGKMLIIIVRKRQPLEWVLLGIQIACVGSTCGARRVTRIAQP